MLYDNLVSPDGPLFRGFDLARLGQAAAAGGRLRPGPKAAFGDRLRPTRPAWSCRCEQRDRGPAAGGPVPRPRVRGRGQARRRLAATASCSSRCRPRRRPRTPAGTARRPSWRRPPAPATSNCSRASPSSAAASRCSSAIPHVIPIDEVVCLKMYHREDEPLIRLFLDDEQTRAARPALGRAPVHHPAAGGREQVPAAVHRLRDPGPAEGAARLLRGPARAVPQAGRGVREGRRGRRARSSSSALLEFAARAYRRPLRDDGEGRAARPVPDAPRRRACRTRRRSAACWPACWCRRRSCSASSRPPPGKEAGPGQRLGTGHPAELLPLVVHARRRAAPARRRGPAARPGRPGRRRRGGC